jgi:hypothetical protein
VTVHLSPASHRLRHATFEALFPTLLETRRWLAFFDVDHLHVSAEGGDLAASSCFGLLLRESMYDLFFGVHPRAHLMWRAVAVVVR